MEKQKPIFIKMDVTEKEKNLIEFLRELGYGNVRIFVERKQPMRAEEGIKSARF